MVERIKELCSVHKTSIKALEKELGFGNGTIRRWDNNAPSIDRIVMVANRFNVPVSFITGEEQNEKSPTPEGAELIPGYSDLNEENKAKVREYIALLAMSERND